MLIILAKIWVVYNNYRGLDFMVMVYRGQRA